MQNNNSSDAHPKIAVNHIYKTFQSVNSKVQALEDVSLKIETGEFVCLVGPSGCGKSSLLNLIAGLDFPDQGEILVDGCPVIGPGNNRIVMFQESALFPWLTAFENILFGLKLKPTMTDAERQEKAHYFLRLVGLEKFGNAHPHELSGGMKQRVALARSLAPDPQVLLMDEPFAALDALTREQLYDDLQTIWLKQHKTIVFVTHNVAEAVCLGDRILLFSSHPGKIYAEYTVKLARPREIRSVEVAELATEITHVLKHHRHLPERN